MKRHKTLISILLLLPLNTEATSPFYRKKAEGWFWYEECEPCSPKPLKSKPVPPLTPTEQITQQRHALEQTLHQAILEPTVQNIKHYLERQKAIMDQSQRFAQTWQKVLLLHPNLDETITYPVNQTARHVYWELEQTRKADKIRALSKHFGLFFFFKGDCPFSQAFAPTLKRFSQKYDWTILPISLDGKGLPEFPEFKTENGLAKNLNVPTIPSVIAMRVETQALTPIAFTVVSEADLEHRIDVMLTQKEDPQ